MTSLLRAHPEDDAFDHRLQLSHLNHIADLPVAATHLAENYTGPPRV